MAEKRNMENRDQESEMESQPVEEEKSQDVEAENDELEDQEAVDDINEGDDEIDDPAVKLENAEKEARDNYDRFLRVTADFENYKKRSAREMGDLRKFANEKILKDMLSVADNLERAIESGSSSQSEAEQLLEGVEITLKDVLKMLENNGVKSFISAGEPFDPNFHQAMMQQPSDDHPENTVLSEMQKGYTIHGRLLRPSLVIVSKAASADKKKDENSAD